MIILVDHHRGFGGGQLALEHMVESLVAANAHPIVARPDTSDKRTKEVAGAGRYTRISLERASDSLARQITAVRKTLHEAPVATIVANTYPTIASVLRTARTLKRAGWVVRTCAILHSYPARGVRTAAVSALLSRVDLVYPVEPGLRRLCGRALNMPILGLSSLDGLLGGTHATERTGTVKVFARADRSKGLHLLPNIFERVGSRVPLEARVAISPGLKASSRYERTVRLMVRGWLEPGTRGAAWLNPGDVYLCTSIFGEAVAFSVQEAMARGCYVVAPRLGAIPSMRSGGVGLAVYKPGDVDRIAEELVRALQMSESVFLRGCRQNQETVAVYVDLWYQALTQELLKVDTLMAEPPDVAR